MVATPLPDWLAVPDRARSIVLAGVADDELVTVLLAAAPDTIELVAPRRLADLLAMSATLEGRPKPPMRVARALADDVEAVVKAGGRRTIVLDAGPVMDHVKLRRAALAAEVRLLAGYDIDPELIEQFANLDAADLVTSLRRRHLGAVVLFDRERRLVPKIVTEPWIVDGRLPPVPQPLPISGTPNIVPTQSLVAAHAKFLVDTPADTLILMHRRLAGARYNDVYDIWRRNLELLEYSSEGREYRDAALARLVEVQSHLTAGPQAV